MLDLIRHIGPEVREKVASALVQRREPLVNDLAAAIEHELGLPIGPLPVSRIARALVDLFIAGTAPDPVLTLPPLVAHMQANDAAVSSRTLVSLINLTERSIQEEVALDPELGATSGLWAATSGVVRAASFEVLAAWMEQSTREAASLVDERTSTWVRPVFDAVLAREVQRAARFERPLGIILCDVDHLSVVNQRLGRGVGDRVLERVGVLLRLYFRQHDWVARHANDSFAILLPDTEPPAVRELAEGARATIAQRLRNGGRDSDQGLDVTLSVGIVTVPFDVDRPVEPTLPGVLLQEAERAAARAFAAGGNRCEHVALKGQ